MYSIRLIYHVDEIDTVYERKLDVVAADCYEI